MSRFTGKVAIVTGSSNGIGRGTAILFAREGAKVTITGRNAERLEETKQQITQLGLSPENVNSVIGDITSEAVQDELINSTINKFGKIDILVNNAGTVFTDPEGKEGINQDTQILDNTLKLNLKSVVELTKKSRPHLAATKGEIVNVSSIAGGQQAMSQVMYYAMSKSALDQFTRCAAIDLIAEGIRVNSVSPGAVSTGIAESMGMTKELSEKYFKFMESRKEIIPARFVAVPEHIATVIAFLADRKASSYIIGQSIVADGGSSLIMGLGSQDMSSILSN